MSNKKKKTNQYQVDINKNQLLSTVDKTQRNLSHRIIKKDNLNRVSVNDIQKINKSPIKTQKIEVKSQDYKNIDSYNKENIFENNDNPTRSENKILESRKEHNYENVSIHKNDSLIPTKKNYDNKLSVIKNVAETNKFEQPKLKTSVINTYNNPSTLDAQKKNIEIYNDNLTPKTIIQIHSHDEKNNEVAARIRKVDTITTKKTNSIISNNSDSLTNLNQTLKYSNGNKKIDLNTLSKNLEKKDFIKDTDPKKILQTRVNNKENGELNILKKSITNLQNNPINDPLEISNISLMLNREAYSHVIDQATKKTIIKKLNDGSMSVQEVRNLLKSIDKAKKYGINLKGKDGNLRSLKKIHMLGLANKLVGGQDSGNNVFSKGITLGLKGIQKTSKALDASVNSIDTYANSSSEYEYDKINNPFEKGMEFVKTSTKQKANRYVKRKSKIFVTNKTKKLKKSTVSTTKKVSSTFIQSFKATIALLKQSLSKVIAIVGSASITVILPLIISLFVIVCSLSVFTGSKESKNAYNTLFASETSEYQYRRDEKIKELEAKKHSQPSKSEFENISDEEYESLLSSQYIPDTVTTEGSSNIDYKAQLALFQTVSGSSELNNETVQSDFLTIIRFWDENDIIESYSTKTDAYNYDVYWTAKKELNVSESATNSNKSKAKEQVEQKIEDLATDGYSIVSKDIKYTTKTNYEIVEDKDEEGNVIGHHKEVKDYTVTGEGSIKLEKKMSKTLTQYIYTLQIKNGGLDDYINLSQKSYKNNKELTITDFTIGKERTYTNIETDGTTLKNMEAIWGYLKTNGFTEEATAGIMGNIKAESNFNPSAVEGNGEGHGLVQWSFGRKQTLFARAASRGTKWDDIGVQLDFLLEELNNWSFTPYFPSLQDLKNCKDIKKVTEAFMLCFERPANQTSTAINARISNSESVYNTLKGKSGTVANSKEFGTVSTISSKSKHYNKTYYYEELLNQQFVIHKENGVSTKGKDLDSINEETIEQVKQLYSSDILMEDFEFLELNYSTGSFGSFGFNGSVKDPIKVDDQRSTDYSIMNVPGNPFAVPQCTWFAWARYYQVYGYDSGARGNGNQNAREIVNAHPDKFQMSSSPAPGAIFSIYSGPYILPQYGHVGFVEAVEGDTMWVSEGNVTLDGRTGVMWFHKVSISQWASQYNIEYAVPIK